MRKIRIICALLTLVITFNVMSIPQAFAAEIHETDSDFVVNAEGAVRITKNNLCAAIKTFEIPQEVAQALAEKMKQPTTQKELYLVVPNYPTKANAYSWENRHPYKGYYVKDWVVVSTNGHAMTPLGGSAAGKNAMAFAESLGFYIAGVLVDQIIAFGSAGVTLCQFVLGLEPNTISASSGDKASAAPSFTCHEYFTYVETPDGDVLGCRTAKTYLNQVSWHAYYAKSHENNTKTKTYNKLIKSNNFDNRYDLAVQHFAIGGFIDQEIHLKIANKYFILQ